MVSDWYVWFCELGYPNLDINRYPDGEWEIIEYYNSPVIPSLTRWNHVLYGIRNQIITPGIIENYVKKFDLTKRQVWDEQEAKTEAMYAEQDALDRHREDTVDRAFKAIRGNEALVERIAKKGITEINLPNIRKNIPRQKLL